MIAREWFTAVLFNGPILPADAMVVLSGDGHTRTAVAYGLLMQGAAHWVVMSGGTHNPPYSVSADRMVGALIEKGLSPDRLVVETDTRNTRDQAEWGVQYALDQGWGRILLVTSAYHMPRAYLTFLNSLQARDGTERMHILPVPASHLPWWEIAPGVDATRLELYEGELAKIEEYRAKGHVASYEDGLAYLEHWEGR